MTAERRSEIKIKRIVENQNFSNDPNVWTLRKFLEKIQLQDKLESAKGYNYSNKIIESPKKKRISPTGNRTPVSRVTGGDTYHYTIEDLLNIFWNAYQFSFERFDTKKLFSKYRKR